MSGLGSEVSISAWETGDVHPESCKRCGATVDTWKTLGGSMEQEVIEMRCRRCRNDQKD